MGLAVAAVDLRASGCAQLDHELRRRPVDLQQPLVVVAPRDEVGAAARRLVHPARLDGEARPQVVEHPAHVHLVEVAAEVLVLHPEGAVRLVREYAASGAAGCSTAANRPTTCRSTRSRWPSSFSGMRSFISLRSSNSPPVTTAYARLSSMPFLVVCGRGCPLVLLAQPMTCSVFIFSIISCQQVSARYSVLSAGSVLRSFGFSRSNL